MLGIKEERKGHGKRDVRKYSTEEGEWEAQQTK
jgi:hypothetical protein